MTSTTDKTFYGGVGVGQLLSLFLAMIGIFSDLLGNNAKPFFLGFGSYALLIITYLPCFLFKEGFHSKGKWWKYAILATAANSATYFTIKSLRYTTVSSWTLIQPSNVIVAIPFSMVFLKARYKWTHFLCAAISISGLVLLIYSDVNGTSFVDDEKSISDSLLGDMMAFVGFASYAIVDGTIEVLIKGEPQKYEVLGIYGLSSGILSITLAYLTGELSSPMFPNTTVLLYSIGPSVANYLFVLFMTYVLRHSGVAIVELSLLTSNIYSLLAEIFIIGEFNHKIVEFCFAFLLIVSGMIGFALSGDPYKSKSENDIEETNLLSNHEDNPNDMS